MRAKQQEQQQKEQKRQMKCGRAPGPAGLAASTAALPPTAQLTFSPELDHGAAIAMSPDDKFFAVVFARSKEVKIFSTKGAKEGAQVTRCERPRLAQPA